MPVQYLVGSAAYVKVCGFRLSANNDPVNFVDPSGFAGSFVNTLSPGDGVKENGGVSPEVARAFNIENNTHDAYDFKEFAKVVGSDYMAPVTELTPANNVVRIVAGVEPLDYFSELTSGERSEAVVEELLSLATGMVGKVVVPIARGVISALDYLKKVDDGRNIYTFKKDTRY